MRRTHSHTLIQAHVAYQTNCSTTPYTRFTQSFLVGQLLFSGLPLLLFVFFAASVIAFALVSAILFAGFWVSVAMLVLAPTLLVTVSLGVLAWVWAAGSFLVARWVYAMTPFAVSGRINVTSTKDGGRIAGFERDEKGLRVGKDGTAG